MKSKNENTMNGQEAQEQVKAKPQFIAVPVDVGGKYKNKNYVDLKGIAYNPKHGNLSLHLSDKHTLILKEHFLKNSIGVVLNQSKEIEHAAKTAPPMDKSLGEKSNARLRPMGEGDGRTFVGVTGSVKYDGSTRGLIINLDDKHVVALDSEVLSKELGITVVPLTIEERNIGLSR